MFWSDTLLLWTINYVMTAGWEWGCVGMIPVSRSVAESCPSGQGGVEWYVPRHLHSSEGDVWPQCGRPYVSGGAIGTSQLSNDTGGVGDNWNAYQLRNNPNSRTGWAEVLEFTAVSILISQAIMYLHVCGWQYWRWVDPRTVLKCQFDWCRQVPSYIIRKQEQ